MNRLNRLLITILLNLSVLAASSGWINGQYQTLDVWGNLVRGQTSVRVDRYGWQIENGVFPFR